MYSNMNDQSVLNIPVNITRVKSSKYKSPDPSPIAPRQNSHKLSDSFKENFAGKPQKPTKLLQKPEKSHRQLELISNTCENVSDLEDFIQKFHPALSHKNVEPNKQQLEKLEANNKSLKKMIKAKEGILAEKVLENSNKITKNIQKTQNEIDALEAHLSCLKAEAKEKESDEVTKLTSENCSISELIASLESSISYYKSNGIKFSQFSVLTSKIIELETAQEKLISKNSALTKELISQKSSNSASKAFSEHSLNISNLSSMLSQILILEKVSKKYLAHESINITELLEYEDNLHSESIPSLISMIRKQIASLRVIVSDLYAENCGNACFNQ